MKTPEEQDRMRVAGQLLARALDATLVQVRPGVTTRQLDTFFEQWVRSHDAEPLFLGYRGYPRSLCTSVNNEVVHAIPSDRVLQEGDIVGMDVGLRVQGWCADMCRTVGVGTIRPEHQRLIDVTKAACNAGVQAARVGNTLGDIGAAVQEIVEEAGFSVVRALVGHGIGTQLHEEPSVANVGKPGTGLRLSVGMTLAIEPMVNIGTHRVTFDHDGWTVRTADESWSAHWEDTVLITSTDPEILTRPTPR